MTFSIPSPRASALDVLAAGIDSYRAFLREDGELVDPVAQAPTQYGTPYHAWGNAVLARHGDPARRDDRLTAALRGLQASVRHVADPTLPATWSGFDRPTGGARSNGSHRDFFWPPILKTYLLLRSAGANDEALDQIWRQISQVDPSASFRSRPPSNWAMVWCSGEYLRIREGGSRHTIDDLDGWLDTFFEQGFVDELGLYVERGIPNAYDLFTRVHLAEILVAGYGGRHEPHIRSFLTAGLRRSLDFQMSDGSLASGYRSTGQTWTLGAQVAFFTHAQHLGLGSDADRMEAASAAERTLTSLALWQRADGPYSPVLNRQPGWRRVGYENYTADGHYANLALGFLASAVDAGFRGCAEQGANDLDGRPPRVRVEHEPTFRAAAHHGRYSIGVQAQADLVYDGTGLVDLTVGAGRVLQIASSARHLSGGPWFNPGLGIRAEPGRTPTSVVSAHRHALSGEGLRADAGAIAFDSEIAGDDDDDPIAGWPYRFHAAVGADGVDVTEATPGHAHHPVLFVPYPADIGDGLVTRVTWTSDGARFDLDGAHGRESLLLQVFSPIELRQNLSADYTNRRGICGLVRLDLEGPAEEVRWRVSVG